MENIDKNLKAHPSAKPVPEKKKVKELKKQQPPVDATSELPIDEGYSKTFLKVCVGVAVFLISITLAGVLGINSMFENSRRQVVSNFTVQVLPMPNYNDSKEDLLNVVHFLEKYPDVEQVSVLSDGELRALLEPWLGNNVDVEILPIPKLLDVKISSAKLFDYKELAVRLSEVSSNASINDHNMWLSRLLRFINSLKMLALTVLILVLSATIMSIIYAAKTSLNVHKDTISILHVMGATDEYIAINYVKQIAKVALMGGIFGTLVSVPAIMVVGNMAKGIEAGIFNSVSFGADEWLCVLLLPIGGMVVVGGVAYVAIMRTLRKL